MTWAPDYLTVPTLARYLKIEDAADNTFLQLWITTVSGNVNDFCGRQFGQVAALEERYYTPVYDRHDGCWLATVDDLQDVTGLAITDEDGTAVAAADYTLLPRNAAVTGKPYEQLKLSRCTGEIAVEALWGWSAQPAAVDTGMLLQAGRIAKRRGAPFGIAGSPSEQGEMRLLAQLDPDFRTSLRPLQRRWWAA